MYDMSCLVVPFPYNANKEEYLQQLQTAPLK